MSLLAFGVLAVALVAALFWILVKPQQERCPTCGQLVSLDTISRTTGRCALCQGKWS